MHIPTAVLHIHLFGHLRLFLNQEPLRWATLPKTTSLLAYLLLHQHTAVSRERLAFLLWDDVSESEARANLRRHLYDLRQALPTNQTWVLSDAKTVRWNSEAPFWLDVAHFEQLCTDINRLAEATALYMGELLPELYEDWLLPERNRLQALYTTAVKQLIQRERQRGDLLQAIAYTRQLLAHDPLQEDIVRDLILLQHEQGDRAGAIKVYQQFAQRLQEELGVTPMPETTAVVEAIRTGSPLPTYALPSPTRTAVPHNLPAQLTSFVGRTEELAQIVSLIGHQHNRRLLTITGAGGTGKTRLALEVAHWLGQHQPQQFPDGIFFIGLAAIHDPDLVATAVAKTVSGGNKPLPSLATLKNELKQKRLLLVLDNFEHLLPAATIVNELLTAVAGLHIIVTSQTILHLYGEYEYPLPPLPLPDLQTLPPPPDLLNYAAVALFVERLQAVKHNFVLTAENSADVAKICTYLDGIPLAIELAAGRGKLFPPAVMVQQLNSRLHFLSGQTRNLPTRHQTLRASIDWSYQLLEKEEQQLFSALSLFAASFSATAVHAICRQWISQPTAVDDILYSLIDKNMVRLLPVPQAAPRFRLLQTLREYGQEKLQQHPHQLAIRQQWVDYYVQWALDCQNGLRTPAQPDWIQQQSFEDANILAVLNWLYEHLATPGHGRALAHIINSQEGFWTMHGRFREAANWYNRALTGQHDLPLDEQVRLLNKAGVIAQHQGDYATAAPLHAQALQLAQQQEQAQPLADTLHYLGFAAGRQGQYEEARRLLEESLAIHRTIPNIQAHIATLLNNLSIVYRRLEMYDMAILKLEEALAIKREIDDKLGAAAVMVNLSLSLAYQKQFAKAEAFGRESLRIRHQLQDLSGMAVSLGQMADLAIEMGQASRAVTLSAASMAQRQRVNLPPTSHVQAEIDQAMAALRQQLGDELFEQAWQQGTAMSMDDAVAFALQS